MNVWDNKEFAQGWNDTYGLDMAKDTIRTGIVYPLLENKIWRNADSSGDNMRLADFGCGNGNLIRTFKDKPFSEWLGIERGAAILDSAQYLAQDSRVRFLKRDVGTTIPFIHKDRSFDHATAIFVIQEMPVEKMQALFQNMAAAVCDRQGAVHIFTLHPAYALHQDWMAHMSGQPNKKFEGHKGYFDTRGTTYELAVMNAERGFSAKADYYHKPMHIIVAALAKAGLHIQDMIEVPAGVTKIEELAERSPASGDVPRFMYIEATPLPPGFAQNKAKSAGAVGGLETIK